MARVQLVIPDEDRDLLRPSGAERGPDLERVAQGRRPPTARRKAAIPPLRIPGRPLKEFFSACDALEGPGREPDWQEHLAVIDESRKRDAAKT